MTDLFPINFSFLIDYGLFYSFNLNFTVENEKIVTKRYCTLIILIYHHQMTESYSLDHIFFFFDF